MERAVRRMARKVNEIVSAGIAQKLSLTGGDGFHMHPPADETRDGFMTKEDRLFLNTVEEGAQKNQNAFSTVNDVLAKGPSDTINLVGGVGISVSTNPSDNKVTITATGESTPGPHGISHNNDGSDPIPDLVAAKGQIADLTVKTKLILSPVAYGAIGDGTTNDTAAFTSLEAVVTGKQIDLGNKTYVVDAIPKKNRYYNGFFKVGGFTRSVILDTPPRFHAFGGQLSKLKKSLGNPLEQFTGIVFVGDSITWGRTLADNGTFEPRTGSLSDPRDKFTSPSFVNEFKRYIGEQYMLGASPILSNWSASTSGEAIAEYTRQTILYPFGGDFTLTTTGTATSIGESQSGASVTGFQKQLVAASTGTGVHTISFNFTGDRFTLCFASTTSTLNYELLVDGVSKGVFSTVPGVDGVISGNNNQREHVFNYVRNKVIQIKTVQPGTSGNNQLRVEGIIINKKVRITNHGIIGATSQSFKVGPMTTSPIAITPYDNYVFCQFGTNDRIISSSRPKGTNTFLINLKTLIDSLVSLADVIIMSANPATDESPTTFSFTMQDVRNINYNLSRDNNIDMIDNYSAWSGIDPLALSDDGLHPNALGHQVIAKNIIGSLEMS